MIDSKIDQDQWNDKSERKCIVVLLAIVETSSLLVWDDFCERISLFWRQFTKRNPYPYQYIYNSYFVCLFVCLSVSNKSQNVNEHLKLQLKL